MIQKHLFFIMAFMPLFILSEDSPLLHKQAPLFKAPAVFPDVEDGKKGYRVGEFDLKEYIGKYKIVLYFYPMDDTPGCTKEAQKFRDSIDLLQRHGIMVVGVSCDSIKSHSKFAAKYGLPYVLVTDSRWKRTISKKYNAAGWFYSKRKTILIDKKGEVVHVFEQVNIQDQIDDILNVFSECVSCNKRK